MTPNNGLKDRGTKVCIAVVGGKLQGTEVVYLANKAGFKTLLIDKSPNALAVKMCDAFLAYDFIDSEKFPKLDFKPDLILPAIEDEAVLTRVKDWAQKEEIPLAFDLSAYRISSSKKTSDALFEKLNLPAPRYWPDCSFPIVVKPDNASGSQGVEIFHSKDDFDSWLKNVKHRSNLVIQEYLEGPSFSIEVIGKPGNYLPCQVTELGMDESYDCNKVAAPSALSPGHVADMENMVVKIAEEIQLKGIMDLEVILHDGKLKLLEIDARFPSQTPMAVYWSTGVNMVEMLVSFFLETCDEPELTREIPALIEHIKVNSDSIEFLGEHIMGEDGPLHMEKAFFGADEAITSYASQKKEWVATLVLTGTSQDDMLAKRERCLEQIQAQILK